MKRKPRILSLSRHNLHSKTLSRILRKDRRRQQLSVLDVRAAGVHERVENLPNSKQTLDTLIKYADMLDMNVVIGLYPRELEENDEGVRHDQSGQKQSPE